MFHKNAQDYNKRTFGRRRVVRTAIAVLMVSGAVLVGGIAPASAQVATTEGGGSGGAGMMNVGDFISLVAYAAGY